MLASFNFDDDITCVAVEQSVFTAPILSADDGIPKGVKFSPDGLYILSATSRAIHVFGLPTYSFQDDAESPDTIFGIASRQEIHLPGLVYDYAWYPGMSSLYCPESALFVSTCKDQPIIMWDMNTGKQRAQYVGYDHMDEIAAAYSVCFDESGSMIYSGFERNIQLFDVGRPGRALVSRKTSATKKSENGQKGILSSLAVCPQTSGSDTAGALACGSYSGSIWCYDGRSLDAAFSMHREHDEAQETGVTQISWSADGILLMAGYRNNDDICVWDARNNKAPVWSLLRKAKTNQRLQFQEKDGLLCTTSKDEGILVYDLALGELKSCMTGFAGSPNGLSLHPSGIVFAVATGQRDTSAGPFARPAGVGRVCPRAEMASVTYHDASIADALGPGLNSISVWRTSLKSADVQPHADVDPLSQVDS